MAFVFQVLSPNDLAEIYAYAEERLKKQIPDEVERTLHSWNVRWRKEALEHYLRLGWSFIVRNEAGKTTGFFIAQPFLFFRGYTQTLWVEQIEADDFETAEALAEVAVKVAKEKHLQRVLFATGLGSGNDITEELKRWYPQPMSDKIAEIKTTK